MVSTTFFAFLKILVAFLQILCYPDIEVIAVTTGSRMKNRRKDLGVTVEEVAEALGVSVATVYRYENGEIEKVPGSVLEPLAKVLRTTPAYLMGWEEPPDQVPRSLPPNITPLPKMKEWPVLGATACGKPLHRELLDETILAPVDVKADVVFRCVGDSMINARIFDGDAVFVHLQPEVENGEIAVVRIGDEYTLKRVYLLPDYVELRAENPTVRSIILSGPELEPDNFEIVGLAVAFLSTVQ